MKKLFFTLLVSLLFSAAHAQYVFTDFVLQATSQKHLYFTTLNGKLYFTANKYGQNDMYVSDGTVGGTVKTGIVSVPYGTTEYKGKMYFADEKADGLWATDGTLAGTQQIAPSLGWPHSFVQYQGKLFFCAYSASTGYELYVTDGTTAGTMMVKDMVASTFFSTPQQIKVLNGKLYFTISTKTEGQELWTSDGTESGTEKLAVISHMPTNDSAHFTAYKGKVYFSAEVDGLGREVWETDGTPAGTKVFLELPGPDGVDATDFIEYNGNLYFSAYNNQHQRDLWLSDGTISGTHKFSDIGPGIVPTSPQGIFVHNGKLFLGGVVGSNGLELCVTEGTPATTHVIQDIAPGGSSSFPHSFISYRDKLYFIAEKNKGEYNLYVTDGTEQGTQLLKPDGTQKESPLLNTDELYVYYGSLYLTATFKSARPQLWSLTDNSFPLSMQNITENSKSIVYPNPASSSFSVKPNLDNNTIIKLYSSYGQLLFQTHQTENVDIHHLPVGIYMVQIKSNGQTYNERLIKE